MSWPHPFPSWFGTVFWYVVGGLLLLISAASLILRD